MRPIRYTLAGGTALAAITGLAIRSGLVRQVVLPGGHHFGGNADAVVAAVLYGVKT